MKITVPATIKVGPHLYDLVSGRKAERRLASDTALGCCDTSRSRIFVMPGQSPTQVADTLLHEVLHAAFDQTSLRQTDQALEEQIVSALTPILLSVIRDNPDLIAVLADT